MSLISINRSRVSARVVALWSGREIWGGSGFTLGPGMLRSLFRAVFPVKQLKALSRRRHPISGAGTRTEMAQDRQNANFVSRQLRRKPFPRLALHRISVS
jgi:hypothetical protein